MEYIIQVNNLSKYFGTFKAVNNISFKIPKGKIFGFLGPNGSGKSTTIRMLCGILSPSEGSGRVLNYDIATEAEKIKQNIGYMSQKFSLYEDLTVIENMEFYAGIYGISKEDMDKRKENLIDLANLHGKENSLAGTLSGGWKQRLALVCALLHQPQLLFLDEPTAGVDPVSRRIFWGMIYSLAEKGVTVLLTTHYMDEAEKCDLLGFIYRGELISFGTPQELKENKGFETIEDVFVSMVEKDYSESLRIEMFHTRRRD